MKARAWIMQARQMKTRCGLLLSTSDGRFVFGVLGCLEEEKGDTYMPVSYLGCLGIYAA